MRRKFTAGIVAGVLLGASLALGPPASADTSSVLSVQPVRFQVADVCWTPYQPTTGTVTQYSLNAPDVVATPIVGTPADFLQPSGNLCVRFSHLHQTWYHFSLQVSVDGGAWQSASVPLLARGYALTATTNPVAVGVGGRVAIRGSLHTTLGGTPVSNASVSIQMRVLPSATWQRVRLLKTASNGAFATTLRVYRNVRVRAYFRGVPGTPTIGAWNSGTTVQVRPALSSGFAHNPIRLGTSALFQGRVLTGSMAYLSGRGVCAERFNNNRWNRVACTKISATGTFSTKFKPTLRGKHPYRWYLRDDGPQYSPTASPIRTLAVV